MAVAGILAYAAVIRGVVPGCSPSCHSERGEDKTLSVGDDRVIGSIVCFVVARRSAGTEWREAFSSRPVPVQEAGAAGAEAYRVRRLRAMLPTAAAHSRCFSRPGSRRFGSFRI